MAKSSLQIRIDYNRAISQASSLEQIASELRNTAEKDFQESISQVDTHWKSTNASAYVRKCNTLKDNIINSANKLTRTAATIRKIAKTTYDAEMRALRLAQIRKY
ncbi:MAG: hypothetical protein Q4B01_09235 [Eubacteriales bacterium]|nr:hypothetical protein [Eubacteriales bacterium]